MPVAEDEYYGPLAGSRGEIYEEKYRNLDGNGDPDLASDREHHGDIGGASGVDLADDRRHVEGEDAPTSRVSATSTDQDLDAPPTTLRTPPVFHAEQGAPAPPFRVAIPPRWREKEAVRRRPETYYGKVRSERDGSEPAAEPVRVSQGQHVRLPPEDQRTAGHAPPALHSVGGLSAGALDWSGTDAFAGVPSTQIGPPGAPPSPDQAQRQGQPAPVTSQARAPVAFRDPIHEAASRVRWWLADVFGPPEDVPPRYRPS